MSWLDYRLRKVKDVNGVRWWQHLCWEIGYWVRAGWYYHQISQE